MGNALKRLRAIRIATMNHPHGGKPPRLALTTIAALGIVFGDIGTSPLYAFRECFAASHGTQIAPITPANLIGAASLIVWSLLLVVTVKYLIVVLRRPQPNERVRS